MGRIIKLEDIVSGCLLMEDGTKEYFGEITANKIITMETPKKVKTRIVYIYEEVKEKPYDVREMREIEIHFSWNIISNWIFDKCDFKVDGRQYFTLEDWQFLAEINKLIQYHLEDLNK